MEMIHMTMEAANVRQPWIIHEQTPMSLSYWSWLPTRQIAPCMNHPHVTMIIVRYKCWILCHAVACNLLMMVDGTDSESNSPSLTREDDIYEGVRIISMYWLHSLTAFYVEHS